MHLIEFQLLLLIVIANGAPILGMVLFNDRYAYPVDAGLVLPDGQRLLGKSKTWRGVLLAPLAAGVMAWLLHLPVVIGVTVGFFAIVGDMLSSFTKRRLGLASSSMAPGLDQIPEALLPLWVVKDSLGLTWLGILETVGCFIVLELVLSRILYWLGIRKRPY